MTRISSKYPHATYGTAVSTLLGLISSAYHKLHHSRSNQQSQKEEAELVPIGPLFIPRINVPNQLVLVRMRNCIIICILKVRFCDICVCVCEYCL